MTFEEQAKCIAEIMLEFFADEQNLLEFEKWKAKRYENEKAG